MRTVATLGVGVSRLLPMIGIGIFFHRHFLSDNKANNPADWRAKAAARCKGIPKIKRRARRTHSDDATNTNHPDTHIGSEDYEDTVLGRPGVYEWLNEDEVEALQQADGNPAALLNLLQQYSGRMVAEEMFDDAASDDSMWFTDEPDAGWQHDGPISQQRLPQLQVTALALDDADAASTGLSVGHSAEGTGLQQQKQQQRTLAASNASQQQQLGQEQVKRQQEEDSPDPVSYFDDSYFGLPADPSAAPQDLQELQLAVSRNLEALLPKDSTWTAGSYPPRFDELLSPGAGPAGLELPEPEFDFDDFDYVPEFDFEPEFDDDMFDFDVDFEANGFDL